MWTQVKRLSSGRTQPHVVIYTHQNGIRLYIPAHLRHKMGDPLYCDLYASQGTDQVLIQPTSGKGPSTRKFNRGMLRLPNKVWGTAVKRIAGRRKRFCVSHELDRGNLRVDLRHRVDEKK